MVLLVSRFLRRGLPVCRPSPTKQALTCRRSAVAIRSPACAFASPSLRGLDIVCDIAAVSHDGGRAKRGLPILSRLRKRALEALTATSKSYGDPIGHTLSSTISSDDDLAHLRAATKLRRVQHDSSNKRSFSDGTLSGTYGAQGEMRLSPHSQSSIATSTTFAEPQGYDPMTGYIVEQLTNTGMVPPPPPESEWIVQDSAQDLPQYSWIGMTDNIAGYTNAARKDAVHRGTILRDDQVYEDVGAEEIHAYGTGMNGQAEDEDFGFSFDTFINQGEMGEMSLIR